MGWMRLSQLRRSARACAFVEALQAQLPEVLAGYERICPGAASDIVDMAKAGQACRHYCKKSVANAITRGQRLGGFCFMAANDGCRVLRLCWRVRSCRYCGDNGNYRVWRCVPSCAPQGERAGIGQAEGKHPLRKTEKTRALKCKTSNLFVSASMAVHVHVSPIPGVPLRSAGTCLSFRPTKRQIWLS